MVGDDLNCQVSRPGNTDRKNRCLLDFVNSFIFHLSQPLHPGPSAGHAP